MEIFGARRLRCRHGVPELIDDLVRPAVSDDQDLPDPARSVAKLGAIEQWSQGSRRLKLVVDHRHESDLADDDEPSVGHAVRADERPGRVARDLHRRTLRRAGAVEESCPAVVAERDEVGAVRHDLGDRSAAVEDVGEGERGIGLVGRHTDPAVVGADPDVAVGKLRRRDLQPRLDLGRRARDAGVADRDRRVGAEDHESWIEVVAAGVRRRGDDRRASVGGLLVEAGRLERCVDQSDVAVLTDDDPGRAVERGVVDRRTAQHGDLGVRRFAGGIQQLEASVRAPDQVADRANLRELDRVARQRVACFEPPHRVIIERLRDARAGDDPLAVAGSDGVDGASFQHEATGELIRLPIGAAHQLHEPRATAEHPVGLSLIEDRLAASLDRRSRCIVAGERFDGGLGTGGEPQSKR